MRFETFIAARYLRAKRKNRFVSLITLISVAGVSVGVIALIVVMGVMTGFDIELRNTLIGNRAHLTVYPNNGGQIDDFEKVIKEVRALCPEVLGAGPMIQIEALLKRGPNTTGAVLLGVDPALERDVTDLEKNLTREDNREWGEGRLPGVKEVVLGYRLAQNLGYLGPGDDIMAITAKTSVRPFVGQQMGKPLSLLISGISDAKMSDFDSIYGYVDLETAKMLSDKKGVDAVHLKLSDPFLANALRERIEDKLPYRAETWYTNNEAFLGALEQEKLAMFVILTFIVLVAAFNITSTLIMVVMEKRRDIGILRTLGSSGSSILLIFMIEGLMIGLSGTGAGVVLGLLLAHHLNPVANFLAGIFGVDLFNSTIYYFDRIPVAVVPGDVAYITVASIALTFLSTLYPAWSAMRLNPVDALRYE